MFRWIVELAGGAAFVVAGFQAHRIAGFVILGAVLVLEASFGGPGKVDDGRSEPPR